MQKYDLFIFDWDGTLMNTTQTIIDATTHACRELGLVVVSDEQAKSIIGKSFPLVIADIVPELVDNSELMQKFTALYEQYLNQHTLSNPLFAHAAEVLRHLSATGKLLAVATGRSRMMLDDILAATGFSADFVITKTADDCFSKPHPQMIEEILAFTGMTREQTVMIGDTTHDLHMAHNAGVDAIGVAHGAGDYADLAAAKPRFLLNNISELYQLITQE